jgi:tRNA G18 (ribose-2'-O)-methylase SpoU
MSKDRLRTFPNLADTSPKHLEAIAIGPDHFKLWERNVADHFKDKSEEEIKSTLRLTANPFAVCMEHLIGDFNLGTVIRNANGFNAKEVYYLGDKKWDRRAAVGVHNYTEVQWIPTIEDFIKLKDQYVIVGIDNVAGSTPLHSYNWKPNTLMVFGEEGAGLTPTMQSYCQDIVAIEMYGTVRSFNCGVASGIVMYDFVRQMRERSDASERE